MQEFLDTYWNLIHSNFHMHVSFFYSLIKAIKHFSFKQDIPPFLLETIFRNNGLVMDTFMKMGVCQF